MKTLIDRLIEDTGGPMTLVYGDGREQQIRGILLPLFSAVADPAEQVTMLGDVSRLRWRYIGPSVAPLQDWKNMILRQGGKEFVFVWAKDYGLREETSHWEGLVKQREDEYGQIG